MSEKTIRTAMILAAGRGERMRPLTDSTPKPLLKVGGKSLIEYHLEKLAQIGVQRVVVNTHWLGEQLPEQLGDGQRWDLEILYSPENPVLETAGGIAKALPMLGEAPILLVNGDVYCDLDFAQLPVLAEDDYAHLVLVDNPAHNPKGDFALCDTRVMQQNDTMLTYSGIGVYRPQAFMALPIAPAPLGPLLRDWVAQHKVSAHYHSGAWCDAGTPDRLAQLDRELS